ncbi:MAG TPA: hypothetical protein H9695_02090 [Candidatus Mediterraneibacter excrementigallinarum]|nr:hypothetical protein [Candidatus Mediterraneibacter excrementigallinarum]
MGFTAVESIRETKDTMTAVVHESGRMGWISEKDPVKVTVDGVDVTEKVEKQENIYTIDLPERAGKAVLCVSCDEG